MKITSSRVYHNRVVATKDYKFDKARMENNPLLFDEDEIKTVTFKYQDRVVVWTSTLDMSFLTEDDVNTIFASYLIKIDSE